MRRSAFFSEQCCTRNAQTRSKRKRVPAKAIMMADENGRNGKPSWLLCTIAGPAEAKNKTLEIGKSPVGPPHPCPCSVYIENLDERMRSMMMRESSNDDSFGARANSYYHQRPHLLAFLQDLYTNYLLLADRYCQALTKTASGRRRCSPSPTPDSDAESTLTTEENNAAPTPPEPPAAAHLLVAELVMKDVELDIIADELIAVERVCAESSCKMDLQRNLVDVLESERVILLNDNATLGYRVASLEEENRGLVAESLFLKRKAGELARCVLSRKRGDDPSAGSGGGVCALSRKIEDLQAQIHRLEKRNEELIQVEDAASLGKCFSFNVRNAAVDENRRGGGFGSWWDRLKKFDTSLLCKPKIPSPSAMA
ncbi:hypothetical protein M569_10973 [Genlisea aurea]|uniref:NAB domain-containing protein n=1 Tax=Genlisea aurea TaxID=192259 RepID=S8CA67_9LAMI|nr:hypothetical protein M569_10973 [Genlisea aurea]